MSKEEQMLIAYLAVAPIQDAQRLLLTAQTIVTARAKGLTPDEPRKKRSDAGTKRKADQPTLPLAEKL